MFNLIKKDFLTLSRSRSDLTELLLMPFILIAILGFALGNLSFEDFTIEQFTVAVVDEQSIESDLEQLEQDLLGEGIPQEVVLNIMMGAEENNPSDLFIDVLNSEDIENLMIIENFESKEAAEAALNEDEVAGVVTIPESFTYNTWRALYFEEEPQSVLDVQVQNYEQIRADVIRSVAENFVAQYNLETSIALATNGEEIESNVEDENLGEVNYLSAAEPITSFQYYTIGMGVMFALSTAPALSSRAFKEKYQHVFGRLMLSGKKPLTYLASKMVAGTLITFIQLLILFLFSTLIFNTFSGRDGQFWSNLLLITGFYSLLVGSVTSLLTSIVLYSNDNATSGFFGGVIVSIFAFIGGSFTPVEQFSETLRRAGNWTPNGAMLTSYLQLMQGLELSEVFPLVMRVIFMTIIFITISIMIFPKRRLD